MRGRAPPGALPRVVSESRDGRPPLVYLLSEKVIIGSRAARISPALPHPTPNPGGNVDLSIANVEELGAEAQAEVSGGILLVLAVIYLTSGGFSGGGGSFGGGGASGSW